MKGDVCVGRVPLAGSLVHADLPTAFALFQHLDYRLHFSDAEQGMALGFSVLCET